MLGAYLVWSAIGFSFAGLVVPALGWAQAPPPVDAGMATCPVDGAQQSADPGLDAIRAQLIDTCAVLRDRLNAQLDTGLDALEASQAILERLESPQAFEVSFEEPATVTVANPANLDSGPIVDAIDLNSSYSHKDAWAVAGLLFGLAAAVGVWRLVRP